MAFTYGSITKCKVRNGQTRNEYECRLGYQVNSQDIATNSSNITLKLECRSISSSYATYNLNKGLTSEIDGTIVKNDQPVDMRNTNVWQDFGQITITVYHNTDGTYSASKTGSFTCTAGTSQYSLQSGSASVTVAPATIPRYATSNQGLASKTSSSITMNWSSDNIIDYIWYSSNNGSTWTGLDVADGTSGSYTISGLASNTTYNIKTRVRRRDSQLTTDSATLAVATYPTTVASISVTSRTVNSIAVSSSSNVEVSSTHYRIAVAGGGYGAWQTSNVFYGLAPNTTYTIQVQKVGSASGEAGYAAINASTYQPAYLTGAPEFNIGQNPTITFNNPSGSTIYVYTENIRESDWQVESVVTSDVNVTGRTSYEIPLPVNTLYSKVPNSNRGVLRYCLRTECNGSSYWSTIDRYYYVTNSNPIFTDFDFEDTNDSIYALTGNRQILVNGYSNLKVSIPTSKKAQAQNYATMNRYRLNVGNMSSIEAAYSDTATVEMYINSINSASMTVTAIDSRGNPTSYGKTATFKAYTKPVITAMSTTRSDGGVGSGVTLSFEGNWWNDTFGKVANTIKNIKYYYKATTSNTWVEGSTTITANISGTKFYGTVNILGPSGEDKGFDIATAYHIKMLVTDALATSTEYQVTLSSGTPALAICGSSVAINQMYDENDESKLQVNGPVTIKNGRLWLYDGIELFFSTPYIDFHAGANEGDYTLRLIEETAGTLTCRGSLRVTGSIDGTVTRAIQDSDGNTINSTYFKNSDVGYNTFKVTRDTSQSSGITGYWAAMVNASETGSPAVPNPGTWWHLLSMDWAGDDPNHWISQLLLPTSDGGVPKYRKNDARGTHIDNSTWHDFITDENIGSQSVDYANRASHDGEGTNIAYAYPRAYSGDGINLDVVNGGILRKSGLYSMTDTGGTWWNVINVRHRNGDTDGIYYGMQMRCVLTSTWSDLQIRQQANNNWRTLENIGRTKISIF